MLVSSDIEYTNTLHYSNHTNCKQAIFFVIIGRNDLICSVSTVMH